MSSAFSDFLNQIEAGSLPDAALAFRRRWLLDLLGVAGGGVKTRSSQVVGDPAVEHFGPGRRSSRVLFDGRVANPAGAALAGGMTIDALDGHDGHRLTKGQVGCGTFQARRFAHVVLALKDGRLIHSPPTEAFGDPEAAADMAQVRAKFHAYAAPMLGASRAAAIEAAVDRLGDGSGMAALSELILATVRAGGEVAA